MLCIDLPGNGREHELVTPPTVEAMTAFVRNRIAERHVSTPCRVLAMSLGAMVTSAWIQHVPEEIERLVLINTSMRSFASVRERLRPAAWPMVLRIVSSWKQPERCEQMIHGLTCNRTDTMDAYIAQWAKWRREHDVSAGNALRQLGAAARFRTMKFPPFHPTLLLSSAEDRLVDPACSVRLVKHWGVDHAVHPWAGQICGTTMPTGPARPSPPGCARWIPEPPRIWIPARPSAHDRTFPNRRPP